VASNKPSITKLTSTDAFVVVDFEQVPASGEVRVARKVLQSSASDLARSSSYTFGAFEIERSGASAGINAQGDTIGDAVQAFVTELTPLATDGSLHLDPAKGVPAGALADLQNASSLGTHAGSVAATVAGIVTSVSWAVGGNLEGTTVAVESPSLAPTGLVSALSEAGASIVDVHDVDTQPWKIWGADVEVIVAGSKPGTLTHQGAPSVSAKAVVPWGPIPVTTKAFAQLQRAGIVLVPDFITLAGGRLCGLTEGDLDTVISSINDQIVDRLDNASRHPDDLFLGACQQAEAFIESWRGTKPFGRPLAV